MAAIQTQEWLAERRTMLRRTRRIRWGTRVVTLGVGMVVIALGGAALTIFDPITAVAMGLLGGVTFVIGVLINVASCPKK